MELNSLCIVLSCAQGFLLISSSCVKTASESDKFILILSLSFTQGPPLAIQSLVGGSSLYLSLSCVIYLPHQTCVQSITCDWNINKHLRFHIWFNFLLMWSLSIFIHIQRKSHCSKKIYLFINQPNFKAGYLTDIKYFNYYDHSK